jgi:hypothetical protein
VRHLVREGTGHDVDEDVTRYLEGIADGFSNEVARMLRCVTRTGAAASATERQALAVATCLLGSGTFSTQTSSEKAPSDSTATRILASASRMIDDAKALKDIHGCSRGTVTESRLLILFRDALANDTTSVELAHAAVHLFGAKGVVFGIGVARVLACALCCVLCALSEHWVDCTRGDNGGDTPDSITSASLQNALATLGRADLNLFVLLRRLRGASVPAGNIAVLFEPSVQES